TVPGEMLIVRTKSDLDRQSHGAASLSVSAVTGEGMDALTATLLDRAARLLPRPGDYALSERQRGIMGRAEKALAEGAGLGDEILIAECLRTALTALDEITGRATTEAVL